MLQRERATVLNVMYSENIYMGTLFMGFFCSYYFWLHGVGKRLLRVLLGTLEREMSRRQRISRSREKLAWESATRKQTGTLIRRPR